MKARLREHEPTGLRLQRVYQDAVRVQRYLRALRLHRVRPDDVYISSYPRSGTTWLQLLVHLVRGGDLSFLHIADAVPWFERPLALGRASVADYARLGTPRSFKSHLPFAWLPRGARYVYVHRDGRDVAASYYYFYRSHLHFEGSFDAFYTRFLRGELQYGSWFRHVADWDRQRDRPGVLLLGYEDLLRDPERGLRALAALCEVSLSRTRIAEILRSTSFDAMKEREDSFDHASAEPGARVASGAFVRRGEIGAHRELMSQAQLDAFEHARRAQAPRLLPELRLPAFLH